MIDIIQHTLKGQKLCKLSGFLKLLPLQGALFCDPQKPRALPWAKSFCPFRACCLYWLLAFRACCLYGLLGLLGVLLIWALNYPIYPPVWLISPSTPSCMIDITQHALKGQKLLAQGNALGIMSVSNAPCKGKSFKIHRIKMEIHCDM